MSASPNPAVKPVPDGYHTITVHLTVPGVARLIEFVKQAFGAEILSRMDYPDGGVHHAQGRIGDSIFMMGEPRPPHQPKPCNLYLYVEDVDAVYARAMAAGGKSLAAPASQFYGDRTGGVEDPSGNVWWIATHIEDVSIEELERRRAALANGH